MTSNSFCRHLSNGYRINIVGNDITWMPCCQWTGSAIPFQDLETHRRRINIDTPWHHRECQRCGQEESYKTSQSYRHIGNRIIPPDLDSSKVGWLDIQADMTCNGGCLICGPWNSSYWQNELRRYQEYPAVSPKQDLSQCIKKIFSALDVSELASLQFLGGEPFLSDTDTLSFPYITHPELCRLKYTTNGSVWPRAERQAQWQRFREVSINFSIDAIGDRFDYLRYPLKWSVVKDNVKRLVDSASPNMTFHINHTLTPLNVYYYQEFVDWVNEIFPTEIFRGTHVHTAYGIMSVASVNESLRDMVENIYGSDHMISKILRQNPQNHGTAFWNHVALWDHRRGTDWRQTFPDIVSCV